MAVECNLVEVYYGRTWPAIYITFMQITHQFQVLTVPLCRAQAIFLCAARYQISKVDLQHEANCL